MFVSAYFIYLLQTETYDFTQKNIFPRDSLVGKMAKLLAERLRNASWILGRARDFHIFHTVQADSEAYLSS